MCHGTLTKMGRELKCKNKEDLLTKTKQTQIKNPQGGKHNK